MEREKKTPFKAKSKHWNYHWILWIFNCVPLSIRITSDWKPTRKTKFQPITNLIDFHNDSIFIDMFCCLNNQNFIFTIQTKCSKSSLFNSKFFNLIIFYCSQLTFTLLKSRILMFCFLFCYCLEKILSSRNIENIIERSSKNE